MRRSAGVHLLFAGLLALFAGIANAADLPPHPALWHVKGDKGELYLFGSIHLLPPGLDWRAGPVGEAISRASVFVFEIPIDKTAEAKLQSLILEKGMLSADQNLHAMLPPAAQTDLDADAAAAGLSPQSLDHMRPWLADLALIAGQLAHNKATPQSGVDAVLEADAAASHKELRYLETVDEQMALIVPSDPKLELSEFISDLKAFKTETGDYAPLVAAWMAGDTTKLDSILSGEFVEEPEAQKALIEDRNRAWAPKLEAMLREPGIFFVTVGAGHLVGKHSVPELLRADGFAVEGP